MSNKSLNKMNNELKVYINEACGISEKCKRKLINLVEKHFYVDLPNDNYLNIDITILENGNIIMRDEEYKTEKDISSSSDLVNRYEEFQKDIEVLLKKNETNFDTKKRNNEISNLLIILLVFIISIILLIVGINRLLMGDLFGVIWLIFIISYYIIPASGNRMRNRLIRAKKYLTKKFTKK